MTPSSSKLTVAQSVLTPISSNRTNALALLNKFLLFNKSRQIQAKRQLRRVFWRQFQARGQFRTVFWTSFSSLSKDAKFNQIDSCAECFDGRQFRATGQLRAVFGTCFSFLTKVANLKQNDCSSKCFDRNFEQQDSCTRSFGHVLAF